jgi:hypothetical protein
MASLWPPQIRARKVRSSNWYQSARTGSLYLERQLLPSSSRGSPAARSRFGSSEQDRSELTLRFRAFCPTRFTRLGSYTSSGSRETAAATDVFARWSVARWSTVDSDEQRQSTTFGPQSPVTVYDARNLYLPRAGSGNRTRCIVFQRSRQISTVALQAADNGWAGITWYRNG